MGRMRPAQAGAPPLPCLGSNNSTETAQNLSSPREEKPPSVPISNSAYKTECCLKENIRLAVQHYGIEHLAFFTLTFAKPVYSPRIAQDRLNSLLTHVIRPRHGNRYMAVFERHESGAIHFHFIVWVEMDIRTGFNWEFAELAYAAQKEKNFIKAGKLWAAAAEKADNGVFLRGQWKFWRELKRRYRWLGRCEILPIRSTAEAIARYTGTYISKHMQHRREEDKGVRLVRNGKGMHWVRSRFAFNSPKCWLWRKKLARFAPQNGCGSLDALKAKFGPRWAHHCAPAILAMRLPVRMGSEVIDAGEFPPNVAQELCQRFPAVSDRQYRPSAVAYVAPNAQAWHKLKVGVVSLVRSVFGKSAKAV